MEPNRLSPREDRAWGAFIHAHQQFEVHLSRRRQESGLSGADYEVLAALSAVDGDRMPAHTLCSMQKDGLISRGPNACFRPAELDTIATLGERVLRHLAEITTLPAEDEAS